jgi:flagellar protein FlbD
MPRRAGRTAGVIPVTCRNGEHFSVDPDSIERIETVPDTTLVLIDGSRYVVDAAFDDLLRTVRDHRATALVLREHLVDGYAATPHAIRMSRHRLRDGFRGDAPVHLVPDRDED